MAKLGQIIGLFVTAIVLVGVYLFYTHYQLGHNGTTTAVLRDDLTGLALPADITPSGVATCASACQQSYSFTGALQATEDEVTAATGKTGYAVINTEVYSASDATVTYRNDANQRYLQLRLDDTKHTMSITSSTSAPGA